MADPARHLSLENLDWTAWRRPGLRVCLHRPPLKIKGGTGSAIAPMAIR